MLEIDEVGALRLLTAVVLLWMRDCRAGREGLDDLACFLDVELVELGRMVARRRQLRNEVR